MIEQLFNLSFWRSTLSNVIVLVRVLWATRMQKDVDSDRSA